MSLFNSPKTLDDLAEEHMRSASKLLEDGQLSEGANELLLAADLHREAGRNYDEARCLQVAASALRSAGETVAARQLADRAAAIPNDNRQLRLSIVAEQAEGAFADADYQSALPLISSAISSAEDARLGIEGVNALVRRRAQIYLALGDLEASAADYNLAYKMLEPDSAGFVRTEQAGALLDWGLVDEAERVLSDMQEPDDTHLGAERLALMAKCSRIKGRPETAIEHAEQARRLALEAVAPVVYFTSSVELAEALQSLGRYAKAYGALARAWATIGDLLGPEVAASWVQPCMVGFQLRWGEAIFKQAKLAYETQRRAAKESS